MKKLLLMSTAMALFAMAPAKADTLDPLDPLISYQCTSGGSGGCVQTDNNNFSPLSTTNFGFKIAPGPATGDLTLGFFVPTDQINIGTFALPQLQDNNSNIGTAIKIIALLNSGDGSSIATYLGLTNASDFSPTDNFANLSKGETTEDPTFSGNYLSFKIDVGTVTLDGNGPGTTLLNEFKMGNLPAGTVIVAFLNETIDSKGDPCTDTSKCSIGTAASNDLIVTQFAAPSTPLPAAVWLFGSGIGGMALIARRRRKARTV